MADYKLHGAGVIRLGREYIPQDPVSPDWQTYLAWVAAGNTPDPADPPPVRYSGTLVIDARVRTTTANVTEIYRATLAQLTLYRGRLELLGVDAGNGNARYVEARIVAKRLTNGAALVGAVTVVANVQDAGASTWVVNAGVSGNDFVVTVAGQAGRSIDWQLAGDVVSFTPGGQP